MALTYLSQPQWAYDDVTKELLVRFTDAPAPNNSDPASFTPTRQATVRIPINAASVSIVNLLAPQGVASGND